MSEKIIKVGITHGDINGIGYEVILKTLSDARILELCTPVIYGSAKVAAYHRKSMELQQVNMNIINKAEDAVANRVNIINCVRDDVKVELSKPTKESGEAAYLALENATRDLQGNFIDVLVTAPINKHNIQNSKFNFPGHTEYLEKTLGRSGDKALMIMVKDDMRIALVTGHVPLGEVSGLLTKELIIQQLRLFNQSLKRDFAIRAPRIAVLSFNPHGGEGGLLGQEEIDVIVPAMEETDKEKILTFGPYPSDGFFGSGSFSKFDGILAMYHDQGLAPFKTLAMEDGVNFTAGLPIVRTSPDHGTAYDIAGKNLASENSFRNALYMAVDVYRNRLQDVEINANPLRKQYFEKGSDNEKLDLTNDDVS